MGDDANAPGGDLIDIVKFLEPLRKAQEHYASIGWKMDVSRSRAHGVVCDAVGDLVSDLLKCRDKCIARIGDINQRHRSGIL